MPRAPATPAAVQAVLRRYPEVVDGAETRRWGQGLIHDTFAVRAAGDEFVLQRVHPVFSARIHENIDTVTRHVRSRGLPSPRLLRADDDRPFVEHEGEVWRLMTRLAGVTFDAVQDARQAEAAGHALGLFHRALADLDHAFVGLRSGVHDTPAHLRALEAAVARHPGHRLHGAVAPLAEAIATRAGELPPLDDLPPRIVHGDPKFNNVLFEGPHGEAARRAVGWIDLDTVGPMPLHLELGDAWRSWCNARGEDSTAAGFQLDTFEASLHGWLRANPFALQAEEREALLHGLEWITLELAARFAADALEESYFGWDAERFPARGEHNLVRAQSQWSLHAQVMAARTERAAVLRAALNRTGSSGV